MYVVFDVDGTLLDITHRLHHIRPAGGKKDWTLFRALAMGDSLNVEIALLYRALHAAGHTLIICTGRMQSEHNLTTHVLHDVYSLPRPAIMLMRPDNSYTPDYLIKRDMLDTLTEMSMRPDMAVDDRQQVVDMWRGNGVRCLQVAPGQF